VFILSKVTKKLSSTEWDSLIQEYYTSGLSVPKWCNSHGFKTTQLRWQITKRQKKNNNEQNIQWVPLHTSPFDRNAPLSSITVKIGSAEISVSDGFNKELFTEVVHSLMNIC